MASDSAKRTIAAELREMRKQKGVLDAVKLAYAPMILKGLGGDSPENALTRLLDLAIEYSNDRDIDAALASFGWGVTSEGSLDRLSEYSERYQVDPRTVRRWSDDGIRKLTLLILGTAPWIQPRIRQVLTWEGGQLVVAFDVRIPPKLRMQRPKLQVDERVIDIDMPDMRPSDTPQVFGSGISPLTTKESLPITLRLSWQGEKFPVYESIVRGAPDLYFSSQTGPFGMRTTVRTWIEGTGTELT